MAKCTTCGATVSLFNFERECDACAEQRTQRTRAAAAAKDQQNIEEQRIAAHQAREQIARAVEQSLRETRDAVASFGATTLVHNVYLPVDSIVNREKTANRFAIHPLTEWTRYGWKVVATVPKTIGIALHNRGVATPFGGGIGGNVAGVYVLLQLEITPETIERQIKAIEAYYEVFHGGSAD